MGIVIGIAGAHRVGKTTLCKELEKYGNYQFVPTNLSQVLKDLNTEADMLQKASVERYIELQAVLLDHIGYTIKDLHQNKSGVFIVDRTPIDTLAYFRLRFNFESIEYLDNKTIAALEAYRDKAYQLCYEHLNHIFLLQPGIVLQSEDGKALANEWYIDQLNTLMAGDMHRLYFGNRERKNWVTILNRKLTNLDKRVKVVDKLLVNKYTNYVRSNRHNSRNQSQDS